MGARAERERGRSGSAGGVGAQTPLRGTWRESAVGAFDLGRCLRLKENARFTLSRRLVFCLYLPRAYGENAHTHDSTGCVGRAAGCGACWWRVRVPVMRASGARAAGCGASCFMHASSAVITWGGARKDNQRFLLPLNTASLRIQPYTGLTSRPPPPPPPPRVSVSSPPSPAPPIAYPQSLAPTSG